MTKRMLINAIDAEECRIVIAENDRLLELEVERADSIQLRGNIYKASITRIEPSLQAAFLDIGSQRNGFLQINDIHPSYFRSPETDEQQDRKYRPAIQEVLDAGQNLVVQVVKDEREAKGATLTTNLSLPGRYLVLMIGNQRGGVSRKISDEMERRKLRQAVDKLEVPPGMGIIVRTAGISRTISELQRDLDGLLELWYSIVEKSIAATGPGPVVLYKESDLAIRTIRDYLTPEVEEILVDDAETHQRILQFMETMMPIFRNRVIFYDKAQPLLSNYHLDKQVEATNQPEVTLPSGGSIVINVTEAVVSIDVNSGRSTSQSDVEETAFNTNLEAARQIATQLRLRDLGGLIVIDFIDMYDKRHKQLVERAFRDAVRNDKAKVELGKISKFGLLELSRQRLKSSLTSQSHIRCPYCNGHGRIKTAESAALEALRKIQSAAFAGGVQQIRVRMAPPAALFLLNNKRQAISRLEQHTGTSILVYADGRMKPDEYELELATGHREVNSIATPPEPRPKYSGPSEARQSQDNRRGAPSRNRDERQGRGGPQRGDRGSGRYAGERGGDRSGERGGERGGRRSRYRKHRGTNRDRFAQRGPGRAGDEANRPRNSEPNVDLNPANEPRETPSEHHHEEREAQPEIITPRELIPQE